MYETTDHEGDDRRTDGKKRNSRTIAADGMDNSTALHIYEAPVQLRDDWQSENNTEIWTDIHKPRFTKRFIYSETYSKSHKEIHREIYRDLQRDSCRDSRRIQVQIICGSKEGEGAPGMYAPRGQILSFSYSFWQNIWKIIG